MTVRCCAIWSPAAIRHRRSGDGYGLSFASPRSVAGRSRLGLAYPSPEAAGSYDAPADRAVQRPQAPAIRATVEHVFAHQKRRRGLFVRIIGVPTPRSGWSILLTTSSVWSSTNAGLPRHNSIRTATKPLAEYPIPPPLFHSNRLLIRLKTHICRRSLHIPCFERCLLARCSSARLLVENRDEQNVVDLQYDLN